jgi:hypothetical protein
LIIDLPTRQNDVLHALIASGGMPGIDAHSEVWVTRRRREMTPLPPVDRQAPQETVQNAQEPRSFRVPLRLGAGEAFPCCERDMVLDDGDVLFVPARNCEVFYTGGLIAGGQFPLPRDRSLSLMEAMAMANGPVGGPAGIATNGANLNFVNGGLGGIVNPTQVIVVRKLPSGEQIKIAVNLNRAAKDEKEQLVIIPNDLILLEFTPKEYASNLLLSLVRPFIIISPIETTAINNAVVNNVAIPGGPAEPAAGGATAP